jgi:hypothetical protein
MNSKFGLPPSVSALTRFPSPVKAVGLALIASAALGSQAHATVVMNFTHRFNDATPGNLSSGTSPWLTLTFDDVAADVGESKVKLSLATTGIVAPESVVLLYFNISDPGNTPDTNSTFTQDEISDFAVAQGTTNVSGWSLTSLLNGLQAGGSDGDGFDFRIGLPPQDGLPGQPDRLVNPEVFELFITDKTGNLKASSFAEQTSNGFYAAAHIQSTGPDDQGSDWVAALTSTDTSTPVILIPEPSSTAALMGLLSCGLFLRSRRDRTA